MNLIAKINIVIALLLCCGIGTAPALAAPEINALVASPDSFMELSTTEINLTAELTEAPAAYNWAQLSGPKVPLTAHSATTATIDVGTLEVAVETELIFVLNLSATDGSITSRQVTIDVQPIDISQVPGRHVQIGGSSTAVARFTVGSTEWCLFNVGTALKATPISLPQSETFQIVLPGFIKDLKVIEHNGGNYAIAALGEAGVALVEMTDPAQMKIVTVATVNYRLEDVTFAEGGGSILYGNTIASDKAPIVAVETDSEALYLGNSEFGIHKTALTNLFTDNREVDGTLLIDQEVATIQYAGERPWGGAQALKLYGGKLFVPLDVLGLGIFDPDTLEQIGRYNLYTDAARHEDYFGTMIVANHVGSDPATGEPYLNSFTGMPDYRQVNYEIRTASKGKNKSTNISHPWADLEREARWFYQAIDVDIAQQGNRTIAYIAYSLGGVVAVDITGFENGSDDNPLQGHFLAYFPAVPANGPDETGSQPASLLPYEGAGKLKESGVRAVRVKGDRAYLSDHFAGLVVLDGAATPEQSWQGAAAPFNNDDNAIAGDHIPDWENVSSYDMSPFDPEDNESLPVAFFQPPCLLATAELNGHGNTLALLDDIDLAAETIDLLECSGAGGFVFVDLKDLSATRMSDRYAINGYFPPTDEIGAAPDGSPTQTISIGHTSGVTASDNYLYVSDGPHGVTAWKITDESGYPTDDIHLVANTVQDEYPVTVNSETIYPPSHTVRNVIDPSGNNTWALCARNGLRRIAIDQVEAGAGQVEAPLILKMTPSDIYEHNNEVLNVEELNFQDHAYGVKFLGDLAFVADGSNGLTVYDVSKDPTLPGSGFFVANLGTSKAKPLFGTAHGVDLWQDPATGNRYALIASGPYGIGVADVTDVHNMQTIKVFEPIKYEDGDVGSADGKASDVEVIGDKAYFTYDSFGVVCYSMADLIAPLPEGTDPTDLFKKTNRGIVSYDYRPEVLGRFKLQLVPGYEEVSGGAVRMDYTTQNGKLFLYVAFGAAGIVKIDFTDPATPLLMDIQDTAAEASDVAISNGRLYIGDGAGGLVHFK